MSRSVLDYDCYLSTLKAVSSSARGCAPEASADLRAFKTATDTCTLFPRSYARLALDEKFGATSAEINAAQSRLVGQAVSSVLTLNKMAEKYLPSGKIFTGCIDRNEDVFDFCKFLMFTVFDDAKDPRFR